MTTWRRKPSNSVEHWNGVRTVLDNGRIEDTCVHCYVSWEWRTVEVSPRHCVPLWIKEGDRGDRPEVSAELATKYRAAVARVVYLAQDRLDLGVAAPWQFREGVTTNASNVLHDICMVSLTTCNGTQFRKTRTQLF